MFKKFVMPNMPLDFATSKFYVTHATEPINPSAKKIRWWIPSFVGGDLVTLTLKIYMEYKINRFIAYERNLKHKFVRVLWEYAVTILLYISIYTFNYLQRYIVFFNSSTYRYHYYKITGSNYFKLSWSI